ncbi:GON-4-like protein isoform X2 [Austrofundulus limnaeus]|nr:PREDICTED: GON-4-like protein isoform X2 [Austrofundulus limnaeus]
METSDDELGRLDIDLDRKSKQHNLTSSNVRAILHEVITHEHVVAMMKAAIRDTQDLPLFEPKMTRSRLKQAVQQGQSLEWNLTTVNTTKPPQFVDIHLEEDEDSSDEEYCPDGDDYEDEEEEEEMFLSDTDSLASSPKIDMRSPPEPPDKHTQGFLQSAADHIKEQMTSTCSSATQCTFLERLNAVEEELNSSSVYSYDQTLSRKTDDDGGDEGSSCLAFRTRSKHPLVNVPLGQLEAELLAPDITDDMYEEMSTQKEEDRHWTTWLQGLMVPGPEDEGDDDDDPEYNFLEDLDEPDLEDYRTDRAVQITKKEVNGLLEELFETLQEDHVPAEDEDLETSSVTLPKFNVPQALCFEAPLAGMLTERRQTVKKQYEAVQQRRALQDTTNTSSLPHNTVGPVLVLSAQNCPALHLNHNQKLQLQQQMQQHVQLLCQVHVLSRRIHTLNYQANLTKRYLEELQHFASCQEKVDFHSSFSVCNLQGALDLLQEVEQREEALQPVCIPTSSKRLLPMMAPSTSSHAFPLLPADAAWLFATRAVFLYPELLPVCSLDPAVHSKHHRSVYTAGEDGLIVLGLKHFEGAVQLISSYLLCKSQWNIKKHIQEMSGPRAPCHNVIKMFLTRGVIPPLPTAASRVQPEDHRPPVDRDYSNMPNWLKNSQLIIQKTRLDTTHYPPSLPAGCTLRLHPYYISKTRPTRSAHRRLFTLAHNASLLPLAKAPESHEVDTQPSGSDPPAVSGAQPLTQSPVSGSAPLAAVQTGPAHSACANVIQPGLPIGQPNPAPLLLPLTSLSSPSTTTPIMHCAQEPGYFLYQMVWTPPASCSTHTSQHALGPEPLAPIRREQQEQSVMNTHTLSEEVREGDEEENSDSTLSPPSSCTGDEEKELCGQETEGQEPDWTVMAVSHSGGKEDGNSEGHKEPDKTEEQGDQQMKETCGEGEGEQPSEEDDKGREAGGGERKGDGDKDHQGEDEEDDEEEEEEDFDDLTQDEDEEEVMSSASEESVLSVPELQETMKQLTWLAAERRLCADGDSEDDQSPTSQEDEEEEEEEDGVKGEDAGQVQSFKTSLDEETPHEEGTPRGGRRCPGRGRGRSRPLRGLTRTRQERFSKDATKLSLLYDENILENDPLRETKDTAFAQSYLKRVREALQDTPEQVEEFVSLLNKFEQLGEGHKVPLLFRKLQCILGNHTELLRDFAAFLHPEQALQCGLFEEQQAFERSRRFLRQLEISFGDNPSHYQRIIKALQTGPDLGPTSIQELKTQMATLLKGHTHLQTEFWVFFDDLRPPPAHPGQFEEAQWPEDGEGGEGSGQVSAGAATGSFEEVTLPELEEEEEVHKIQPITSRRQRRKMNSHRSYKGSAGVSRTMKSLNPLYCQIDSTHNQPCDKNLDVKRCNKSLQPDHSASWEGSFPLTDDKEEEEEDEELNETGGTEEEEESPVVKRRREDPVQLPQVCSSSVSVSSSSSIAPRPSPPPDLPVCAKNMSLTASGEKVILWTREADRVILMMCQQEGANQNTFQIISSLLGNKSPNEVSHRFRDLMRLFRTSARHTSSEDEAPPSAANDAED